MSNPLLPCPFCGGEAKITARDVEPQCDPWYGKNIQTFVICTNCGACLFDDYFHEGFAYEREAIAAWNRRAGNDTNGATNADRIGGTDYFTLTSLLYDAIHSERVTTETCAGCRWRGRHQKCSCCRRNRSMRDLWEEAPNE